MARREDLPRLVGQVLDRVGLLREQATIMRHSAKALEDDAAKLLGELADAKYRAHVCPAMDCFHPFPTSGGRVCPAHGVVT